MKNKLLEMYENVKKVDTDGKIMPFIVLGIIVSITIFLGILSIIICLFIDFNIRSIIGIIVIAVMLLYIKNIIYDLYNDFIIKKIQNKDNKLL